MIRNNDGDYEIIIQSKTVKYLLSKNSLVAAFVMQNSRVALTEETNNMDSKPTGQRNFKKRFLHFCCLTLTHHHYTLLPFVLL